jgi:pimeloyl-ACP methyl ester carboxylesterase/multisubunit Na+/H+ antiporter MnhB subunit
MVDSVVGGEFLYLNVPESDHTALIDFRKTHAGNNRRHIFENVLKNTVNDEFNPESSVPKLDFIEPWDIDPSEPDPEVKQVVFVIHGIRDVGHWTQKIALETKKLWREAGYKSSDEVAVVTSSYGFFSMLEFILAIERFRKIQWLVDRYVEAKRLYPNAKFSFIGHSNGTYLVAQALKLHKDIEFDRLAFAGSVVSANYKWYPLLDSGNVKFVLNVPATFDWVVSLFPRVADALPLQWLLGPNLGAAGVIPFKDKRPKVRNQKYKNGQHGVAIKEDNWEDLARFAILNKIPNDDEALNNAPCRIFGEKIGDLTCVAAITILIFLFFYHIPLLIWGNPLFCVCFSVSLLFGTGLLITILQGYSDLSSIDSRERFRKRSTLIALVAVVMVIILLSLTIYASLFYNFEFWDYWNSDIPDGWRGAAIVSYIVVLYAVLTKV